MLLGATEPSAATLELLEAMGGRPGQGNTIELPGREPIAWAQTSTLVALALGSALTGKTRAAALGFKPLADVGKTECRSGIAVYVARRRATRPRRARDPGLEGRRSRPRAHGAPRQVAGRLAELVVATEPGLHWLSIHRKGEGRPMVFAATVLRGRLATIVVQLTAGIRLFQYQPPTDGSASAAPDMLRRVEYLERLLLAGRLDGARELALELPRRTTRSSAA